MEIISSKNICNLLSNTLKLIDKRPMEHGARVAYIVYKMLQCKGGFVEFEMADFAFLATLHDIGAYKTDDAANMLTYETKSFMPHSIYGSLFMRYLSPMKDKAKVLLYHHVDYVQLRDMDYEFRNVSNFIGLAERIDLYMSAIGKNFDYQQLYKFENKKYSAEAFQLLRQAQVKYDIFAKLRSGEYQHEMEELYGYLMFSNEEKKQYMELLMYTIGFRSEYAVVDTVTTVCICEEIAKILKISADDRAKLYYATLLHDVGMLAIPSKIIDAPRTLTPAEVSKMRTHVNIAESILKPYLDPEILEIAIAHHERLNGTGYYRGLKEEEMNILQMILQVADTVTGMTSQRSYRAAKSKDFVISVLEDEAEHGRFHKSVVKVFCRQYDSIMGRVSKETERILLTHKKLNAQYNLIYDNFSKE